MGGSARRQPFEDTNDPGNEPCYGVVIPAIQPRCRLATDPVRIRSKAMFLPARKLLAVRFTGPAVHTMLVTLRGVPLATSLQRGPTITYRGARRSARRALLFAKLPSALKE